MKSYPLLHVLLLSSLGIVPWSASRLHAVEFGASDLKDVVQTIAVKEGWDPEAVRVLVVDDGKVRIGKSQKYDFHVRVDKKIWIFRISDEVAKWKNLKEARGGVGTVGSVLGQFKRRTVKPFELQGPLELHVVGDDGLSLLLPLNTTHADIKKIIVGNGIKVRLEGAEEVSLIFPSNLGKLTPTKWLEVPKKDTNQNLFEESSECTPLLSVYVKGAALVAASRTRNPVAFIETTAHSPNTIELLPEKCYESVRLERHPLSSVYSLSSRINVLEKILRLLLGSKIAQNEAPQFVKAKIMPSTLVKFWLELERDTNENDNKWKKVAEWKTRPTVENSQFEVVARLEGDGRLKPVVFKKVRKPFVAVESIAWSHLLSNVSLTKILSLVVYPEPLTLDAEW